jgi:hypothetical protein
MLILRNQAQGEPTMANNRFPYTAELKPFQDADDAWSVELQRCFGKNAGQARYEPRGKGDEGSKLRKLHDLRMIAQSTWHQSAY